MKKLESYNNFLKEKKLSYFAFDWDDNILHMPTSIHMDKLCEGIWLPVSVFPSEFALIRNNPEYRVRDNNPAKAYEEFKDYGPRGNNAFLEDTKFAITNNNIGPSWKTFLKCLKDGSIFAIITARGHEYDTLKEGVKYIINNCLSETEKDKMYKNCLNYANIFDKGIIHKRINGKFTDNTLINRYLECCKYYGVGAPYSNSFLNEFNLTDITTIEDSKKFVLDKFIEICKNYGHISDMKVSIGFSDDDKKTVEHIKNHFEAKSSIHIHMKLNVFDTSDKGNGIRTKYVNGIIETIGGENSSNTANSLLRYDGFNSQSRTLQNSTNDWTGYNLQQQAKVANGIYKKTFKKKPKKKLKRVIKKATI
jgi:hypothetical protein